MGHGIYCERTLFQDTKAAAVEGTCFPRNNKVMKQKDPGPSYKKIGRPGFMRLKMEHCVAMFCAGRGGGECNR